MEHDGQCVEDETAKLKTLERRLWEAEQTIQAIRNGEVDALVISVPDGEKLYTLRGADHGYRTLVESINEGALILSKDDSIYYCNQCFAEMVKVPVQKITGTRIDSYIVPESRSGVLKLIEESRGRCGKAEGEFMIERDGSDRLPVKLSLNCVKLPDFDGVCAVVTDLSLQKKTELELKRTAEKLRRSNEELQDFAFIASHDLQEPLRKIQAFGDRLARTSTGKLNELENDFLIRMQNSAKRMQQFIYDLLSYSRLTSREAPHGAVDLRRAVEEAISNLELRIEQAGATLEISDLPTIKGEESQLQQLFQNLLANSLKFRREVKPEIKIYSQVSEKICEIYLEDNGIGFEEKYLDRIFVPFQRLHGRSVYEGTGMGLAICRKIVERHGGNITARSTPGKGSVFIIRLPLDPVVKDMYG